MLKEMCCVLPKRALNVCGDSIFPQRCLSSKLPPEQERAKWSTTLLNEANASSAWCVHVCLYSG